EELGRGAFGRVFLAQQDDLAGRHVALKISTDLAGESQTLAQLQHTNIVPIYSIHRSGPFQAVCMPYFGSTTLEDVLNDLETRPALPESGKGLIGTLLDRRSRTLRRSESKPVPGSLAHPPHVEPPADPVVRNTPSGTATLQMLESWTY